MTKYRDLFEYAIQFEKSAQAKMPAAPEDVENAFKTYGVWELSNEIAPILNKLKIADSVSINLGVNVLSSNAVKVTAVLSPADPAKARDLQNILQKMYGLKFVTAIQKAKLNIIDPIDVSWLKF